MPSVPVQTGRGILRPFQRDRKNDFANGSGEALLSSRIGQILGTRAASGVAPGEVAWRPAFGSRLHLIRHANNDAHRGTLARSYVVEALSRWEPLIVPTDVKVVAAGRQLTVVVHYKVMTQAGALGDGGVATIPVGG